MILSLKRVFRIVNGSTPDSTVPDYWNGDIPWVTPSDLGQLTESTIVKTERNLTKAGYTSCGTTLVPQGSLVLSTRAPIGHLAIAGRSMCSNQGIKCLVFRNPGSQEYFFFQLHATRDLLQSLGTGATFTELASDALGRATTITRCSRRSRRKTRRRPTATTPGTMRNSTSTAWRRKARKTGTRSA